MAHIPGHSTIDGTWDYSDLAPNIVVGDGCYLENRASFERCRSTRNPGLSIGDGSRVYMWTVFNIEPEGAVFVGRDTILVGAVMMCADLITIGARCTISYGVTIADSDFHPRDPGARRRDAIANAPGGDRESRPEFVTRPVTIGNDVAVGIGAIILKGAVLEDGCQIGAGAVVAGRVGAGTTVAGNPARVERLP